jgi:hypothetical protein
MYFALQDLNIFHGMGLLRSLHDNRGVIDKTPFNNQRSAVMVQRVCTKQISTSETVKADNSSQFVSAYI